MLGFFDIHFFHRQVIGPQFNISMMSLIVLPVYEIPCEYYKMM